MGVSEEEASLLVDEKLLRLMDQLELLEQKRSSLESLIEQGWFSMTQARYTMGNKQVSSLQYPSVTEPLVCVHTRKLDNGEVEFCIERLCNKESIKDQRSIENIGPQEEGVRRRNKLKMDTTEKESSEKTSDEKASEMKTIRKHDQNPQQDPLKWFGVLVPQSLKQAQSSFKQALEVSAEIASLQTAVLNSREELKQNLKNKCSLGGDGISRLDGSTESKQEENEELPATDPL
ncbi:coiled-coil domain-containing protein 115 [Pholidichthys leucotaenia]